MQFGIAYSFGARFDLAFEAILDTVRQFRGLPSTADTTSAAAPIVSKMAGRDEL